MALKGLGLLFLGLALTLLPRLNSSQNQDVSSELPSLRLDSQSQKPHVTLPGCDFGVRIIAHMF